MVQQVNNIIQTTLDIIGYAEDKDEFVKKFIEGCDKKTIADQVSSLPPEKQEELKQELSKSQSQEDIKGILAKYFSEEQYSQSLEKVTKSSFQEYIDSVMPALTEEQKKKLDSYLSSLQSSK